MLSARIR